MGSGEWVYPNIDSDLVKVVDHAIDSIKSYGTRKYSSRRDFFETAARLLLKKEGVDEKSSVEASAR